MARREAQMEPRDVEGDLTEVLYTEEQLQARIAELEARLHEVEPGNG